MICFEAMAYEISLNETYIDEKVSYVERVVLIHDLISHIEIKNLYFFD